MQSFDSPSPLRSSWSYNPRSANGFCNRCNMTSRSFTTWIYSVVVLLSHDLLNLIQGGIATACALCFLKQGWIQEFVKQGRVKKIKNLLTNKKNIKKVSFFFWGGGASLPPKKTGKWNGGTILEYLSLYLRYATLVSKGARGTANLTRSAGVLELHWTDFYLYLDKVTLNIRYKSQ